MTYMTNGGSANVSSGTIFISVTGSTASGHYSIARLNQSVNLTSYSYVKIATPSNPAGDYIGVSTNASLTSASFNASTQFTSSGTVIVNVSSLSGDYYIYFYHRASSSNANGITSLQINEIYLSTT